MLTTFTWSEATSTLSVSAAEGGGFPGQLAQRSLHLVRVRVGHGVGYAQTPSPDAVLTYTGVPVSVTLPKQQLS